MDRLAGKVAIVTSGGSGLGEAMPRHFKDGGRALESVVERHGAGAALVVEGAAGA